MIKVYIASPYTLGDPAVNVKMQMAFASILIDEGFCPFVPLLYHFQHLYHPKNYDTWMGIDLEWLLQCDCLLRLPGESKGADQEVAYAESVGMPVFYCMEDLRENYA